MQLDLEACIAGYKRSRRRLLVLGYNATLTTAVEAPRQPKKHFDQIQASHLACHAGTAVAPFSGMLEGLGADSGPLHLAPAAQVN